jgi:hypothetical protein
MHREAEVRGARHKPFEVALELGEASSLRSAVWLVGDLEVFTDVGVDRLEAVRAQRAEALLAHPGVDLAYPVPLEHGEAMLLEELAGGSRRGGGTRVRAQHHKKDRRGDKDSGDRRPLHHHTSRRAVLAGQDSSAARPCC